MQIDEKGISLIEVLLAASLMGGLALVGTQIAQQGFKSQKTAEAGLAKINLQQQLIKYQAINAVCEHNLKDKIFSGTVDTLYNSPAPGTANANYRIPPYGATIRNFLEINQAYQTGFSANTWNYNGYVIRNSKSSFPAVSPAGDTTATIDVVFQFTKKTPGKDYHGDIVTMVVSSEVTAQKDGANYRIKTCSNTTSFNPEAVCRSLGGTYTDLNLNGIYDNGDRCTNIAGYHFNWAGNNTVLGDRAFTTSDPNGTGNVAVGPRVMTNALNAYNNVGIGPNVLIAATTANDNAVVGSWAGTALTSGEDNTGFGAFALSKIVDGDNNVAVGYEAGANVTGNSSGNIFIGHRAGPPAPVSESNMLYIGTPTNPIMRAMLGDSWRKIWIGDIYDVGKVANGGTASTYETIVKGDLEVSQSLEVTSSNGFGWSIKAFGDITSDKGLIGQSLAIKGSGHVEQNLLVWGNLTVSGTINGATFPSDQKFKTSVRPLDGVSSLKQISSLDPVSFKWNEKALSKDRSLQLGFIAQDLKHVFPNIVKTINDKEKGAFLAVDYLGLIAPMVSAMQELDAKNKNLKMQVDDLRMELAALKAEIRAKK
jgi:type II secretory pathway pseudopilin PulG